MKKVNIKDLVVFVGVMMFLVGALCLDSSLKVGAVLSLTGVAIGFLGETFFY